MLRNQNNTLVSSFRRRFTLNAGTLKFIGRAMKDNPTMVAGLAVVVVMVLVAIFATVLFTDDPRHIDTRNRFVPPSLSHWFGTDHIGRDIYTRTIYGSRVSLIVGFSVALISMAAAVIIGLVAGYYRAADAVIMRVMDGIMSIPGILLAIALMALLGGSVQNVIIALCVVESPRASRVVRGSVLVIREQMYVEAARSVGVPAYRILALHVLPNIFAPLIVQATFICATAIIVEAYISFLGAGAPPDEVPSWGNVMSEGQNFITRAVWIIFFPGLFLTLTVLGINLAGDGLRDRLDPKLRGR